jgi:hypothetical protein
VLKANSSADLKIHYTSIGNKISITDSLVGILSAGRASITAMQGGNDLYLEAQNQERSFCITPARPAVSMEFNHHGYTLISSSPDGNQWHREGEVIVGMTAQQLLLSEHGEYYVTVQIDDCISSPSETIKVLITDVLDNSADPGFIMFPNPVRNKLLLSTQSTGRKSFQIVDSQGRIISAANTEENSITLDTENLSPGIYLIRFQDSRGVHVRKLIK